MNARERYLAAISGGETDRLALTIWNNKLHGGDVDEQLLDLGVCVIVKSTVWQMEYNGIQVDYKDEKMSATHTRQTITYHTRHWNLREVRILEPGISWIREFMGMEAFSLQLAMNPGRLHCLERALKADWKQRISTIQSSPARYAIIEGNTDPRVVGPQMFLEYYLPYIQEACQQLHENKILAGAHLDSNNRELTLLFAETDLDLIESFTPPPDCDMSLTEARRAWPGKALQVHFPSSIHLYGEEKIRTFCESLVKEMENSKAIAIGVNEDVPNRGRRTLLPMYKYLEQFSQLQSQGNHVKNHVI